MKSRSLVIWLSMLGILGLPALPTGLAAQENSQPHYRVIALGTLGGTYSQPFYVSSKGVASGEASLADGNWHATLWQGPFRRDLGTLGGLNSSAFGSPNAIGQVVGEAETSHSDPNGEDFCGFYASGAPLSGTTCLGFLWQNGSMIPLSTLGGYNGAASAINNQGEVAGNAEAATTDSTCPPYNPAQGQYQVLQDKPVVWENGHIKALPTYEGDPDGFAIAINDHGQVAGASGVCSTFNVINGLYLSPVHALLWDHGKVTNLGSLGGNFGNQAHGMNNRARWWAPQTWPAMRFFTALSGAKAPECKTSPRSRGTPTASPWPSTTRAWRLAFHWTRLLQSCALSWWWTGWRPTSTL